MGSKDVQEGWAGGTGRRDGQQGWARGGMGRSSQLSGRLPASSFCLFFSRAASLARLGRGCDAGSTSHSRAVPGGTSGASLCLALLHGGRAAVTKHLHHRAVAHGFEDFLVSGVEHFKEGSLCGHNSCISGCGIERVTLAGLY